MSLELGSYFSSDKYFLGNLDGYLLDYNGKPKLTLGPDSKF